MLGPDDGAWAASLLSVTDAGTFEHGTSTLQLRTRPDDDARWQSVRSRLFATRAERTYPARDDKVVAGWNGLAISALVDTAHTFERPDLLEAALAAGRLLREVHVVDGRLRRVSRDGVVGSPAAVLEDVALVASAFLDLGMATADPSWYDDAAGLIDQIDAFAAPDGGFYDTAADAEQLVARPRDPSDNASPSGSRPWCTP